MELQQKCLQKCWKIPIKAIFRCSFAKAKVLLVKIQKRKNVASYASLLQEMQDRFGRDEFSFLPDTYNLPKDRSEIVQVFFL